MDAKDTNYEANRRKEIQDLEAYYNELNQQNKYYHTSMKQAFNEGNSWFRASRYIIKEVPHHITIEGKTHTMSFTRVILPDKNAKVIRYQPFNVEPPPKKPMTEIADEQYWGPHVHLMRLNSESEEEILKYVHQWGLLGLWKENDYKDLQPRGKPLIEKEKNSYYIEEYAKMQMDFNLRWGEPLELFKTAAKDFQDMVTTLTEKGLVGNKQKDANIDMNVKLCSILNNVSPYTWIENGKGVMAWNYDNLYKAIVLMTVLDWTSEERGYRRCAHKYCKKIFLVKTEEDKYCSFACGVKNRRNKSYLKHEKPNKIYQELTRKFPDVDHNWLKDQVQNLLSIKGVGPIKAAKIIGEKTQDM